MNINDEQFQESSKKDPTSWKLQASASQGKASAENALSPCDEIMKLLTILSNTPLLLLERFEFLVFDALTGAVEKKYFSDMPEGGFAFFDRFSKKLYFSSEELDPAAQASIQNYLAEEFGPPIECIDVKKEDWDQLHTGLKDKNSHVHDWLSKQSPGASGKELLEAWEDFLKELEHQDEENAHRQEIERELSLEQLEALLNAHSSKLQECEEKYRKHIQKMREKHLEEKYKLGLEIVEAAEIRREDTLPRKD